MPKVRLARVARLIARVAEIALSDYSKCSDSCQRSAVIAVQFVSVIAVHHNLPFETARQLKTFEKHVSWVQVSFARVTIAIVLVTVARSILFASRTWTAPQFDPRHLYVSRLVPIQISRIQIKVHKAPLSPLIGGGVCNPRTARWTTGAW